MRYERGMQGGGEKGKVYCMSCSYIEIRRDGLGRFNGEGGISAERAPSERVGGGVKAEGKGGFCVKQSIYLSNQLYRRQEELEAMRAHRLYVHNNLVNKPDRLSERREKKKQKQPGGQ